MAKLETKAERYRRYNKTYRDRHKERLKEMRKVHNKTYKETHPENYLLSQAKHRAKTEGLPFDLEPSDISIPPSCPILDVSLQPGTRYAPSLDKLIPAQGYTKDNVHVVSWKANLMKQDATPDELLKFADWIYKTFGQKHISSP